MKMKKRSERETAAQENSTVPPRRDTGDTIVSRAAARSSRTCNTHMYAAGRGREGRREVDIGAEASASVRSGRVCRDGRKDGRGKDSIIEYVDAVAEAEENRCLRPAKRRRLRLRSGADGGKEGGEGRVGGRLARYSTQIEA